VVNRISPPTTPLPEWSPRLPQGKIRRLYELDAAGIYDEDFLDEIGWGLRARCESFVSANQAVQGHATCPVCATTIDHHSNSKNDLLICPSCNWSATWDIYFATIQHKQLSGAEPVLALFRSFIEDFPLARTPAKKMFLIDRLVHGFHYYGKTTTRPVAINLIEGRLNEVIDFLDNLTYGENSTDGLLENRQDWVEKSQNARNWGK
jgi:hypothetical protein